VILLAFLSKRNSHVEVILGGKLGHILPGGANAGIHRKWTIQGGAGILQGERPMVEGWLAARIVDSEQTFAKF
jgi:hypothetical protein